MADSEQRYRSLLTEIAKGLSKKDIEDMVFVLHFDAALDISNGTQLLREMEKQNKLDEDNLDDLKRLLEQHNHKKLAKKVTAFEEAQKSEDPFSKTWPTKNFSQQIADKQRTQSVTTEPAMNAPAVPPFPASTQQQYYDPHLQGVVPIGYQSHMTPPQMANVGYPPAPTSSSYEGRPGLGTPGYGHGGSEQQAYMIQQLEEMLRRQKLQETSDNLAPTAVQYTSIPGHQQHIGTQHAPEVRSRVQSYPQASEPPQAQNYISHSAPSNHAKVFAVKSAPCATSAGSQHPVYPTEPEASLKLLQAQIEMGNQTWNIPPMKGAGEGMPKAQGQQTQNGNIIIRTSSIEGQFPSNEVNAYNAANIAASGNYQTGRVPYSVENNVDSTAVAAQPSSSQSQGTSKQLNGLITADHFENGPYHVKIPEGLHIITTEGDHVLLPYGTNYTIKLVNNDRTLRCSATVSYNGQFAGDWTIDPMSCLVVERPTMEQRKFCFIDPHSAPAGLGVTDNNPNNGLIQVVFTPEKNKSGLWNDVTRGFGNLSTEQGTDYFGADDAIFSNNDVPRSLIGPLRSDLQAGATILRGTSNQQFTASEHFELDHPRRRLITFKLVGQR